MMEVWFQAAEANDQGMMITAEIMRGCFSQSDCNDPDPKGSWRRLKLACEKVASGAASPEIKDILLRAAKCAEFAEKF